MPFQRNLLQCVMKACDKEARNMRERCYLKRIDANIRCVEKCVMRIGGRIITNPMKEVIRIADASESLKAHVKEKCKCNTEIVDVKIRDIFANERVTALMIACLHGFNHF